MTDTWLSRSEPRAWLRATGWLAAVLVASSCGANRTLPEGPADLGPTVILVGLDGFRWDFLERASTPALDRLVAEGVRAERMVPVFPSKTFPNHYSIVTGLYAEDHGIVANTMYDVDLDAWFRLGDPAAVGDGRWWGGEPIWVSVETQGLVAAAFFWPGTEAPIQGVRPTYWKPYDGRIPNADRVTQVLAWLDRPVGERPNLVTLYFSDVDGAAHQYGPDGSPELTAAIEGVDRALGLLLRGLDERGITQQVNVIVVSDHGMTATSPQRVIFIDDFVDVAMANVIDWNPVLALRPDSENVEAVYDALVDAHPRLAVFRKEHIPERFHFRAHPRITPIIGIADEGWSVTTHDYFNGNPDGYAGGTHGYDHELESMGALFVASGPAFKQGLVIPPFQNIHLYDLMCAILGLEPAANAGSLDSLRSILAVP